MSDSSAPNTGEDVHQKYLDLTYYVVQQRKKFPEACSKLRRKALRKEFRVVTASKTSGKILMKPDVQEMITNSNQLKKYAEEFKKEFDKPEIRAAFEPVDIKSSLEELDQLMESLHHIAKARKQMANEPPEYRKFRNLK